MFYDMATLFLLCYWAFNLSVVIFFCHYKPVYIYILSHIYKYDIVSNLPATKEMDNFYENIIYQNLDLKRMKKLEYIRIDQ